MFTVDPKDLNKKDIYKLLTGSIVPRPIAFVTTTSTVNGAINAAPFSYFNIVSSEPPLLSLSIGRKQNEMKDTARNALANRELVIHISTEHFVEEMNQTSASLSPEESELELTKLQTVNSTKISVPGVQEAKIRFECKVSHHYEIKNDQGETVADFIMAEIVYLHITEDVYDREKEYILSDSLRPVARLAGAEYAKVGEIFRLERPK